MDSNIVEPRELVLNKVDGDKRRLITSALPYVNNEPHLGNLLQVLSADVFARFCRLKGYETFYVCGTDEYGTATETKALEKNMAPYELCTQYFKLHKSIYEWFDISFDSFSRTSEAVHAEITQGIFKDAYRNGYIIKETSQQFYCPACKRFLADRFVTGICPVCGGKANADQCENCGTLTDVAKLQEPECTVCGSVPYLKSTENLAIDLPALKSRLSDFIKQAEEEKRWSNNAIQISKSWIENGLRARSITRDLKWGIKVPLEGFRNKVFYVWFDAPIGYISLTAKKTADWEKWWKDPDNTHLYQFIGKDNIPFHTVIFPCTQFATGGKWTMLYKMNSSEYLNFEGGKFSKSRGVGVFGSDCRETGIESDLWRFYLYYNRPEKSDADFTFDDFQNKINSEIVGNFSNLVNRVFVFLQNNFDSVIPDAVVDDLFYNKVKDKIEEIDRSYEDVEIRDTLKKILELCDMANKYFQDSEPWKTIKSDYEDCASVMRTLINVIKDVAILIQPYMPSTSDKLLNVLRLVPSYGALGINMPANLRIADFGHLFDRISDKKIQELKDRFCEKPSADAGKSDAAGGRNGEKKNKKDNAAKTAADKESGKMKDFRNEGESVKEAFRRRANLKVSKIIEIKRHPDADKLYILGLDTGEAEHRTIVSSIVPYYKEEELLGHNIVLVSNLKPANFRGVKSFGMLLAASDKNDDSHSTCDVIFADDGVVGENIYPEGTSCATEYGSYLKPEHFFSIPLYTENGVAKVDGAELVCEKSGCRLSSEKYPNGNIG